MKKILLRASKSPFAGLTNGPIPRERLLAVYDHLRNPGTRNTGNLLFANATHKSLSADDVDIQVDDYRLTLDDRYVRRAEYINSHYDAYVIPLCNSFRLQYSDSLEMMTRVIRKLRIPCVVAGVGAQLSLNRDFSELSAIRNPVREFVSSILDRSASIGVRGEITRDYLVHLGFPGDLIDVIGCPSMFYNGESMQITKPVFPDRIALNFNITGIRDPRILEFTSYFNSHPENVTYIPQVRRLMPSVARGESPDPTSPVSIENVMPRVLQPDRIVFFCDVSPWIEFMKGQSFSIGTRIHGNIVPLLAGTPSHVIAHDSRTLELARYFEIPHTPLDDLSGFDVIKTFQKSDYTGVVRGHPARTRAFADFLQRNGLNHILYDAPAMERYEAKLQRSYESDRLPKRMSFLGSLALRSKNLHARVFRSSGGAH